MKNSMKVKNQLPVIFAILISILAANQLTAQENEIKPSLDNGPIKSQFDYLITKSSTYQDYKVVKTYWLSKLKSNVSDSLNTLEKELYWQKKMK